MTRFINKGLPLKRVREQQCWGLKARNLEQKYAFDLLMDPKVELVSLIGPAGVGKTLLSIAAGLEQTIEKQIYKKILISRPVQPMGKDIGYLPGSLEEKMMPYLQPIYDNIGFLMQDTNSKQIDEMIEEKVEIEALTYIRGRSIRDAFIILDESQNMSTQEIKTVVTRLGEGAKIVLCGDSSQIDNVFINEISNGLTQCAEKMKKYDLSGHMILKIGERSRLATIASEAL